MTIGTAVSYCKKNLHQVLKRKRTWKLSVPDDRVLCYDGSVRHIGLGRLAEEVRQRLSVRVREGLADDMCTGNIRRDRCVTILHPDRGTLNSIQGKVQACKKAISLVASVKNAAYSISQTLY
jgi:hypothetical protein